MINPHVSAVRFFSGHHQQQAADMPMSIFPVMQAHVVPTDSYSYNFTNRGTQGREQARHTAFATKQQLPCLPNTNMRGFARFSMMRLALITLALLAATTGATAAPGASKSISELSVPTPGNLDHRVRVFAYSPDIVYSLNVTVGMHTHLQLGPDEQLIEQPRLGETIQWRVSGNAKNLYVKALRPGTSTSMTLVTDRRVYQLELVATTQASDRTQKAYFSYPDDDEYVSLISNIEQDRVREQAAAKQQHLAEQNLADEPLDPSQLTFYRVEGAEQFMRMRVFDDGVRTWMRMPPGSQDLPAVFSVGEDKRLMPVNYTVADRKNPRDRDVIIIDRTAPQWLLKLGKEVEVRIVRE